MFKSEFLEQNPNTNQDEATLRAQQKITLHFCIPSSRHLRPISNHR